jgi:transglutaminase-like putative cysteine protease
MVYHATHITRYTYKDPVSYCLSEARLKPRVTPWQSVKEWELQIIPEPAGVESRRDYFGNELAAFTVLRLHDGMT